MLVKMISGRPLLFLVQKSLKGYIFLIILSRVAWVYIVRSAPWY